MKNKFLILLLFFGIFLLENRSYAEEVIWDFQNPRNYFYNKDYLIIDGGQLRSNLKFTESKDYQDDGSLSWNVASGDFNGDGKDDVYVANWGQNQLWINQGDNKFKEQNIEGDGGNSQAAVAVDFDNDGDIDIYLANFNDRNKIWINDGKANFDLFEIENDGGFSYGAYAKDFNNDGNIDIYVRNHDNQGDRVWLSGFYTANKFGYVPYLNPTSSKYLTGNIEEFSVKGMSGDVKFQISFDSGKTWYYWNNNQWTETTKINGEETSSVEEINENIIHFDGKGGRFKWRVYLKSEDSSSAKLDEVKILYDEPNYSPEIILDKEEIEINEGKKDILKIEAIDKNKKQVLTYFVSGIDGDLFKVDGDGNLSFKEAPDYENPRDRDENNEYKILIGVSDSGDPEEEDVKNLKIIIKNLDFKLTSYKGAEEVEFLTKENSMEPFVKMEVDNPEGGDLKFLISGGEDYSLFNLDPISGELSFANPVDFENPSDKNKDNVYEVELVARVDNSKDQKATQKFLIEIIDVHENKPPEILTGNNEQSLSLGEFSKVVAKIEAIDPDDDKLSFSLGGGIDYKLFEINSESGELSFREAPDYENPRDKNKDNIYEIRIMVQDNGNPPLSTAKDLKIYVNNLGRINFIGSGAGSFDEVCKDSKASNFSPVGVHNQKICQYEKDNYNYGPIKTDSYNCPADQILTQNMLIGDRNNKYSGWQKSIIKEVKILQEHLNKLGFNVGEPDGVFGPATENAVREAQKFFDLEEDGMAGPQFRKKINSFCDYKKEEVVEEPEIEGEIIYTERSKGEVQQSVSRMMLLLQSLINRIRL